MNYFKMISALLAFVMVALSNSSPVLGFGNDDSVGRVITKNRPVWVIRSGAQLNVGSLGLPVKVNDIIKTGEDGKATVQFKTGNNLYIAPSSEVKVSEDLMGEEESGISRIINLFYGKIRAKIQKTRKQRFKVKTATATIGVKGTDFIAEYQNEKTTVGTIEGLVFLFSDKTKESVDIPGGSMSFVSPAGEVMPLEEFAGEMMEGVEFAGEKMETEDIAGEKIEM